ncbi:MAG: hypothetical protein E7283_04930 [Lachnospiraceae bacterium]|nr:hypothetical protein [Lachnospiraceae bacterium]
MQMSERRVKEKLYSAVEHNVPDVLDNILAQCDTRKGDGVMTEKKRKNPIFKIATAMAAMLVLVVGIIGASQITGLNDVETVIAFDVNPSIEIEVNSRGQVIDVKALNEDAQIVVGTMKFRNVDLEVAVNAIIGSMLKNGYLSVDQNSILVSVHSRNSEKAAALKETISTDITAILDGSNIEASVIVQEYERNEEVDKIAKENKISHGKAKLIARIIKAGLTDAEGYEYTYERLAALTVNELRVLWNSKDVELDDVQSSGTASETKYLGKAKALELAYAHAAVVVENVVDAEVDMDYEDGIMVYEIEFYADGYEYEYKLNAITGEILVSEKSEEPEEDDGAQIPDEEVTPEEGQNPDEETTPDEVKPGEQESPDKTPGKEDNKDHPSRIGRGNAKKIAMNHAGFTRDKLRDLECDFDEEDGKYVYKVEFEVDGVEYTYVIDVNSGEILHIETETEEDDDDDNRKPGNNNSGNEKPGQGQKPDAGQRPGAGQNKDEEQRPVDKPQIIQKEKVLAMVLKDANVTMKEVKDLKCELEEEDGAYCYEIEFEVKNVEYEYKVDALTGEILEVNKETEDADEADAD